MPCSIRNPNLEACALPWPFRGILAGGHGIALDLTAAAFLALVPQAGPALIVTDLTGYTGPYNTTFAGSSAAPTDLTLAGAIAAGTTLAAGTGISTAAGGVSAPAGDLAALGGFKMCLPVFTKTLAADQTALELDFGSLAGDAGWVAPSAGSLLGFVANLDTAVTGSAKVATLGVYKNGVIMNALTVLAFTSAAALVKKTYTVAKDTYAFAAGDIISVKYTSDTITSTPKVWACVIVEC